MNLQGIPSELSWLNKPENYTLEPLQITAHPNTDWFISPQGDTSIINAHALLFSVETNFILSSKVTVDFKSSFDAGVLALYQNDTNWAKLCFELSPAGDPMVVSVVTRGTSDDCNSVFIDGASIYLRIAKLDNAFAFHHSTDGHFWHFVRTFALKSLPVQAGFLGKLEGKTGARIQVRHCSN